ncbi:CSE1_5 [Sanghuangporus weigelae]
MDRIRFTGSVCLLTAVATLGATGQKGVTSTNAALCNSQLLFNQEDIHEIAENDYLIKCVMRVILTARTMLVLTYQNILQHLIGVLGAIAKSPSNSKFYQYETVSALIRFTVATSPVSLSTFEKNLFGPFTIILQQDINEITPGVSEIALQMLELHCGEILVRYRSLRVRR